MDLSESKSTETDTIVLGSTILGSKITTKTPRLTIRADEAARRKIADTDGMRRRKRQVAENNRLI